MSKEFSRLPKQAIPHHYDITIAPNFETFVFTGSETIHLDVKETTNKITLNSHELDIKTVSYVAKDEKSTPATKIELSAEDETATFEFPNELPVGRGGRLSLTFVGKLNDQLSGFYRTKYSGRNGEIKYGGATQFEAIAARWCFPCWDEPSHKATFDVTVFVVPGFEVLSNMPVIQRTLDGELEKVKFDTTPIMSTYLVALVIGEFDSIQDKTDDGILVTVYAPPKAGEQGRFALEVAKKALPYYTSYFGIPYPLPKLDLTAIADFRSGAMENWGLITFRENTLLIDPANSSAKTKQWVALVVAHEIAHQWFGNLVTMEWWTHLWLNEGYASFIEFLCVDHVFPEYDIWTQFLTETHIPALELDALRTSHPIEVPIGHPAEIKEIFDAISYNKGASVIRMLHSYIGDRAFREGMNLYLTRRKYANAVTEDLWDALEEASEKPVREVMSTWTRQQGFPVIEVEESHVDGKRILKLRQERFIADGSADEEGYLWRVPIEVITSDAPNEIATSATMDGRTMELAIDLSGEDRWIKINPGAVGFYRTRYRSDALAKLMPAIRDRTLPTLDRLGLVDDLLAMVQAGHASTVDFLRFVRGYENEDNYTVWCIIANGLSKIGVLVSGTESEKPFKEFGRKLFGGICERSGWDAKPGEGHLDTLLRSLVLNRMIAYEDEGVANEAINRFEEHRDGRKILSADLRSAVYRAVLAKGGEKAYERLVELYCEIDSVEEKDRIMNSWGSMRERGLLKRALEFSISDKVRAQETSYGILSVGASHRGRSLAWEFVKANWDGLRASLDNGSLLTRLVKGAIENFVHEEQERDAREFFEKAKTDTVERSVQQGLESIRLNRKWWTRDRKSIEEYFGGGAL